MDTLMQFVFNGTTEFTPYALMCYMVFVVILSTIASIANSALGSCK